MDLSGSNGATTAAAAAAMAWISTVPVDEFTPWAYSSFCASLVDARAHLPCWTAFSQIPYTILRTRAPRSEEVCPCIVTAGVDGVEMASIVPAARGRIGFHEMQTLGLVPVEAHGDLPVNKVPLVQSIHKRLDQEQHVVFFPQIEAILARIAAELAYRESRKLDPSLPLRPHWSLFYERLEAPSPVVRIIFTYQYFWSVHLRTINIADPRQTSGAIFSTHRDTADAQSHATSTPPLSPLLPVIAPTSVNLLVWAFWRRFLQHAPAPANVQAESRHLAYYSDLLIRLWKTPDSEQEQLDTAVSAFQQYVQTHHPDSPNLPLLLQPIAGAWAAVALPTAPPEVLDVRANRLVSRSDPAVVNQIKIDVALNRAYEDEYEYGYED
ncbi:hypothetical protein JCM10213_009026 [Rhodosporidiobolus nylandii]